MSRLPVLVLSGPSGVGKSSVIAELLRHERCRLAVSAATRAPRPGEVDGVHYRFMTPSSFHDLVSRNALLEHAEVHGHCYGTPVEEVDPWVASGWTVLLDIDVQGYRSVKRLRPSTVGVFIKPPSFESLRDRLQHRKSEDAAAMERRLDHARRELAFAHEYEHVVINDDLARAVHEIEAIVGIEAPSDPNRLTSNRK